MRIEYPLKKKSQYNKLDKVEVYANDNSKLADDTFLLSDFPSELTSGKNSFKIKGNEFQLKTNSQILIEIIDSKSQTIFHEITSYIDRQGRRLVTIYVYPDSSNGLVTITILGILKDELVPENWQGRFNVKWQTQIPLDSLKRNYSEIIFNSFPTVLVQEQFKPDTILDFGAGSIITLNSSSLNDSTFTYSYPYSGRKLAKNNDVNESLFTSNRFAKSNASQSAQINYNSNIFVQNQDQQITDFRITAPFGYYLSEESNPTIKLELVGSTGFNKELIGGQLTINSPINKIPSSSFQASYSAVISDVVNKTTLRLNDPFTIPTPSSSLGEFSLINNFGPNLDYSISYYNVPEFSGSQAYKTFASIAFYNLNPISGDIYRIKTYAKSKSSLSDFELVGNQILSTQNMLIDSGSLNMMLNIGQFTSQSIIDTYWLSSSLSDATNVILAQNDTYLIEGMYISGSLNSGKFLITPNRYVPVYDDNQYKLKLNCYGITKNDSCILKCYMSGSGFNNSDSNNIGKYIGKIEFSETERFYQNLNLYFEPDRTGFGKPIFLIEQGEWIISDVRIEPLNEAGFTPNYFSTNVPINSVWDNNTLDFKFEFFDYTEKMSDQIIMVENVTFNSGSPSYIQGNFNLLTGSQYIGNRLQSGIEMSGINGSVIRSVGYKGFDSASTAECEPGFMLWSGSLNTFESSGYSGSGVEFFATTESYFRYRTESKEVDIVTPTFYLGGPTQYISGATGSIKISSSGFSLDSDGSVEISSSGFNLYSDGSVEISSSGFSLDATGSVEISSPGFSLKSDGTVEISSSGFSSDSAGTVTFASQSFLGMRKNEWIRPQQMYFSNTIGSASFTYDYTFNAPCAELVLIGGPTGLTYSSIYFSYLLHDFVLSDTLRTIIYYKPTSLTVPVHYTGSFALFLSSSLTMTTDAISDNFSNDPTLHTPPYGPILQAFSGNTVVTTGSTENMNAIVLENQDANLAKSGQLVNFRLDINNLQHEWVDMDSGSIYLYGIRNISDL